MKASFGNSITDVFFDLDHTLWDFDKNSALTFEKILGESNIPIAATAFVAAYIPLNEAYWKLYREGKMEKEVLRYRRLKDTFEALQIAVGDAEIHFLSEAYIAHLSSFTHLMANAVEILEYLKPKYRLHIITNGFCEVQHRKLENTGIRGYFDQVVDSETAGAKKPNPLIFSKALEAAGTVAQKACMIGDNLEADILGAQAVGLHTLHLNGKEQPSHQFSPIIHTLDEIKHFL